MKSHQCPICGKAVPAPERVGEQLRVPPYFPFCSERCKMVDLGRWMLERYKISKPLSEADDELDLDTPDS